MAALSTKDKVLLKLSRERVERWNRERCKPARNAIPKEDGTITPIRGRHIITGGTDWKQDETILPDRLDAIYRESDGCKVRTMAGKLSRHGERPTYDNAVRTQADGTTQVIVYDPSRDYVNVDAVFAELRKHEIETMPARVRRKLGV